MAADMAVLARHHAGDAMVPRPFVVRDVVRETDDTVTLVLEPVDGDPMRFRPGQFTMVGRPGFGEVPISISGDAERPAALVHTVRAVGDATAAIERARPGDMLLVRGPYGRGWGAADAAGGDVLVIAGGIGLAPLRPLALEIVAHRKQFRRFFLVLGSRSPAQLLYRAELERWRDEAGVDLVVTVDSADLQWRGPVGVVTTALPRRDIVAASTFAFVCGPEIMMRLTAEELCHIGIPEQRIRLSMERNMKCGVGLCGHCQLREHFVCLDGPVFDYTQVRSLLTTSEL